MPKYHFTGWVEFTVRVTIDEIAECDDPEEEITEIINAIDLIDYEVESFEYSDEQIKAEEMIEPVIGEDVRMRLAGMPELPLVFEE